MPANRFLLPLIVFSQFAGTSLWFAGNAVINDITPAFTSGIANITSIVQFGFIAGTLVFSLLTIADRFSAPKVFFFSSLIAALANLLLIWLAKDLTLLFALRFITGFFLAGIYPIGMKIAADNFPDRLGKALGFLVGALVLGTAFPHLVKSQLQQVQWQAVLIITSSLALLGGLLVLMFIPSNKNNRLNSIEVKTVFNVFGSKNFRAAAFGYFGHMWELYAFWAFVPFLIETYNEKTFEKDCCFCTEINVSLWSFIIIAMGALGCILGGKLSQTLGSKKVAFYSLLISGICCLMAPLFFQTGEFVFLTTLLIWGFTVVSDSPQFSTLVAQSAPAENKGTALTIVTCIGFAITIASIQLLKPLFNAWKEFALMVLFIGPAIGLLSLKKYS